MTRSFRLCVGLGMWAKILLLFSPKSAPATRGALLALLNTSDSRGPQVRSSPPLLDVRLESWMPAIGSRETLLAGPEARRRLRVRLRRMRTLA